MKRYISLVAIVALLLIAGACCAEDTWKPSSCEGDEVKTEMSKEGKVISRDKSSKREFEGSPEGAQGRWDAYDPNSGMPNVVPSDSAYELR